MDWRLCSAIVLGWIKGFDMPVLSRDSALGFGSNWTLESCRSISLGQECLDQEEAKLRNGPHGQVVEFLSSELTRREPGADSLGARARDKRN